MQPYRPQLPNMLPPPASAHIHPGVLSASYPMSPMPRNSVIPAPAPRLITPILAESAIVCNGHREYSILQRGGAGYRQVTVLLPSDRQLFMMPNPRPYLDPRSTAVVQFMIHDDTPSTAGGAAVAFAPAHVHHQEQDQVLFAIPEGGSGMAIPNTAGAFAALNTVDLVSAAAPGTHGNFNPINMPALVAPLHGGAVHSPAIQANPPTLIMRSTTYKRGGRGRGRGRGQSALQTSTRKRASTKDEPLLYTAVSRKRSNTSSELNGGGGGGSGGTWMPSASAMSGRAVNGGNSGLEDDKHQVFMITAANSTAQEPDTREQGVVLTAPQAREQQPKPTKPIHSRSKSGPVANESPSIGAHGVPSAQSQHAPAGSLQHMLPVTIPTQGVQPNYILSSTSATPLFGQLQPMSTVGMDLTLAAQTPTISAGLSLPVQTSMSLGYNPSMFQSAVATGMMPMSTPGLQTALCSSGLPPQQSLSGTLAPQSAHVLAPQLPGGDMLLQLTSAHLPYGTETLKQAGSVSQQLNDTIVFVESLRPMNSPSTTKTDDCILTVGTGSPDSSQPLSLTVNQGVVSMSAADTLGCVTSVDMSPAGGGFSADLISMLTPGGNYQFIDGNTSALPPGDPAHNMQ